MLYIDNRRSGGITGLSLSQVGLPVIPNQIGFITDPGGPLDIHVTITLPVSWVNISVSLTSFFEFFLISGFLPDSSTPGFIFTGSPTYWTSNLSANCYLNGNVTNNPDSEADAIVGYRFIGQAFQQVTEPTSDSVVTTPYSFIYKTSGSFSLQGQFTPNS